MPITPIADTALLALAKQFADMENGRLVADAEWYTYLTLGAQALHDVLIEAHGHEPLLKSVDIQVTAPQNTYVLPNDINWIKGVDYSLSAPPSRVADEGDADVGYTEYDSIPIYPYTFSERNAETAGDDLWSRRFTGRPMRWRTFMGFALDPAASPDGWDRAIRLVPVYSGYITVWYLPNAPVIDGSTNKLLPISGYKEFVCLYAARRALQKEESDYTAVSQMLAEVVSRLKTTAETTEIPGRIQDVGDEYW